MKKEGILKYKLLYTALIVFMYAAGRCIPLYGIDTSMYSYKLKDTEQLMMQTISGDAHRSSVFALGFSSYMISTILVQAVMMCIKSDSKEMISPGKVKRISTGLFFAITVLQAFIRAGELKFATADIQIFFLRAIVISEMTAGVMIMLWLAERNGKYGIGGRTILILINILSGLISKISGYDLRSLILPGILSVIVIFMVIVLENSEKRIPVQRVSIHNTYADQSYMAIKLNPVGVMPLVFSTAMFMIPKMLFSILNFFFPNKQIFAWCQMNMSLTEPVGIAVYISLVYLLTIGYSLALISPKEVTEQFLKSGDSIVDLHPGRDTRRYLRGVVLRISFFSATVLSICVGIPLVLQCEGRIDNTLGVFSSSVMMLTGLWCTLFREVKVIRNFDKYQPFF